ncbi:MAG: alanine--tRNA ligase, partial [Chlamydiales bacterium]|nr:alanine--tRNA ligase [Chlamydiales bacterium]
EIWNLVFMQFNRDVSGKLVPLPKQSIDTGSGLERVVSLKMGVDTVFETDIFTSLISQIEKVSGKSYTDDLKPAFHVIADHIRSLSFAIADGAQPSNIERGYILRKLLRRAVRYGRMLEMQEPFLAKILPKLIEVMGPDYLELKTSQNRIAEIVTLEEEAFLRTLKRGGNILSTVIEEAKKDPRLQISGEKAFKLKDTYGLPLEEILLIAKDCGLQVNLEAYQILEEEAKEKSRSAQTVHLQEVEDSLFKDFVLKHPASLFLGYDTIETEATITAVVVGGQFVETLREGEEAMVILNKTPFYAEMGGQIGDKGVIFHQNALFQVSDCHNPYPGVTVHIGRLEKGTLLLGEPVTAQVEAARRQKIANNHTTTHLLHFALEKVLGGHIRQAGSLVEPARLRFDFSHHKALSKEELRTIEDLVNEKIREDSAVDTYELSFEEVQARHDIKQFFGEKYGSKVRVIDIDYSKELCGGTHTNRLGTIGFFKILKEGSIASGIRRIEAVTGKEAELFLRKQEELIDAASHLLSGNSQNLLEKITGLLEEKQKALSELKQYRKKELKELAENSLKRVESPGRRAPGFI